jgi:hypothetical protein
VCCSRNIANWTGEGLKRCWSCRPPCGRFTEASYVGEDVENILFICGGAFIGLEKVIQRRLGHHVMGYRAGGGTEKTAADRAGILELVEPEDLLQFGFIPEFIGRLPLVTVLAELTQDQLVSILTDTRNALIKQFAKLMAMDGVDLEFTPDALQALAAQAIKKGTGSRALRTVSGETDAGRDVRRAWQRGHSHREDYLARAAGLYQIDCAAETEPSRCLNEKRTGNPSTMCSFGSRSFRSMTVAEMVIRLPQPPGRPPVWCRNPFYQRRGSSVFHG